jgi:hypothetical protein
VLCDGVRRSADDMVEGVESTRTPLPLAPAPTTQPAGTGVSSRTRMGDVKMVVPTPEAADTLTLLNDAGPALVAALTASEAQGRYFLAGGLCASASHALATPIDVVKTRQQTVASYRNLSLVAGLSRVAADEGPAALLTGVVPTVVGCRSPRAANAPSPRHV